MRLRCSVQPLEPISGPSIVHGKVSPVEFLECRRAFVFAFCTLAPGRVSDEKRAIRAILSAAGGLERREMDSPGLGIDHGPLLTWSPASPANRDKMSGEVDLGLAVTIPDRSTVAPSIHPTLKSEGGSGSTIRISRRIRLERGRRGQICAHRSTDCSGACNRKQDALPHGMSNGPAVQRRREAPAAAAAGEAVRPQRLSSKPVRALSSSGISGRTSSAVNGLPSIPADRK